MKQRITFLLLLLSVFGYGQDLKTSDFIKQIEKNDISDLWTLEKFQIENDTTYVKRSEPLGYIGANYQRFYIHFSSVIQNSNSPLKYFVYGKTKVDKNICGFQGVMIITESKTYSESEFPNLKQGFVKGEYEFFEDPDQKGTGILKGKFQSNFYVDPGENIKYDALMFVADGFKNNQFEGIWVSYKTGDSKKCNWGDYRIPDSGDLDIGAGEFGVSEKYASNGWIIYMIANGASPDRMNIKSARKTENEKWWLNNEK